MKELCTCYRELRVWLAVEPTGTAPMQCEGACRITCDNVEASFPDSLPVYVVDTKSVGTESERAAIKNINNV